MNIPQQILILRQRLVRSTQRLRQFEAAAAPGVVIRMELTNHRNIDTRLTELRDIMANRRNKRKAA